MLNRTVILAPQTRHVTERVTEHVHEHRAPTDASVRLLSEMETAARDKIVEAIHVGDTTFECVVHIERRFENDDVHLIAVFSLNGKKLTAEHIAHRDAAQSITVGFDRPKAFAALRDAIAAKIANEVLTAALRNTRF